MLNAQMWKAPVPGSFENSCSTSPILVLQNLKSYVYLFDPTGSSYDFTLFFLKKKCSLAWKNNKKKYSLENGHIEKIREDKEPVLQ